jgi:glycine dehydrogenase subunit 2
VPRAVKEGDSYRLEYNRPESIGRVHAFHGNFSVLVRAYSYIRSMGPENLKKASQLAVLNANYIKEKLKGMCCTCPTTALHARMRLLRSPAAGENKVTTLDMAKRLIDYGYHPPTIYFPLVVPGRS